jgi:hypothetical protein
MLSVAIGITVYILSKYAVAGISVPEFSRLKA